MVDQTGEPAAAPAAGGAPAEYAGSQPKPWLRWLAILVAVAAWCFSAMLLRVSSQAGGSPLLDAVCGAGAGDCTAVLTSPQAYFTLGDQTGGPRIPISALGMAYFAFVALWYLFIGPPARNGRYWHFVILLVVLVGAWQSASYMLMMRNVLQRWCAGCVVVHALNAVLLLVTLAAWPWSQRPRTGPSGFGRVMRTLAVVLAIALLAGAVVLRLVGAPQDYTFLLAALGLAGAAGWPTHRRWPAGLPLPTARLALAALTAGVLFGMLHLFWIYLNVAAGLLDRTMKQYTELVSDPAFVRWDLDRQAPVELPLYPDEVFGGAPDAPHTAVVFGDFHCPACRQLHEMLVQVAQKYPDRLRVAFRYFPQDSTCNPNPKFRGASHPGACRVAQAAEAARVAGGREAYLAMRKKLWEEQARLPKKPPEQQSAAERALFENWAAELGLDPGTFAAALESEEVRQRIEQDIATGNRLDFSELPVVYLDGKRLRGWSKAQTWDAALGQAQSELPATHSSE
ncbi:MAG: thioredoxin domain-containing protein [Planctomycetota bacterium]